MGSGLAYFKHPLALVESRNIGERTRVWAFAHIMDGACIGTDCNICDHVFIESHVEIGDGVTVKNGVSLWDGVTIADSVFIGPNAVFTNDKNPRAAVKKGRELFARTIAKQGASIGANATIVCGVTIGRYAFVGAGAVVTKDVPDYSLVVGSPARHVGYVCECGIKLGCNLACSCGKRYLRKDKGLAPAIISHSSNSSP